MKKKNGFTLVEIVISIVILALLGVLLSNRIVNSDNKSKQKIYNAKIELALSAARTYGRDHIDELDSTDCNDVSISRLISLEYLESDNSSVNEYVNPVDNSSLTNKIICVKYINGKVEATLK